MVKKVRKLKTFYEIDYSAMRRRWILKDKADLQKICDYLQKINYSIDDLNGEVSCLPNSDRKDIVYIISLID